MKLIQRIGYYLGGFSIGLVILAFFLNGKKTSCSYGPDSRVLKNINTKRIVFGKDLNTHIINGIIDSANVYDIIKKGDINFSKSIPRKKPCAVYVIEGEAKEQDVALIVKNCDSVATILNILPPE